MFVHIFHHINDVHIKFLDFFPGVPAFFFFSGFLIYASYNKSKSNIDYFINRFLRLFPGLLVVCLAGVLLVIFYKGYTGLPLLSQVYVPWFLAQVTLGQAYNPAEFRNIGVGVVNGSLWTITVEILFYLSVPIIVFFERYFKYLVHFLFCFSFLFYAVGPDFLSFNFLLNKTFFDFMSLTPIVWGWMFLSGVLAFKYFDYLKPYLSYFWLCIPLAFVIAIYGVDNVFFKATGNQLGLIYFSLYVTILLYVSFGLPHIRLPFDLSYGIYIWHMIAVNFLLVVGVKNSLFAVLLTIIASIFSWYCVEKPALNLKKYSIRR
jgi:peptidoglycan/LPS O-acetylase OafA/YrhL